MKGTVIAALVIAGVAAPCDAGPAAPAIDEEDPVVVSFTKLVNAVREDAGCGPLEWHAEAAAVAVAHSRDMRDRNFFSHTNPDGEDPFDRLAGAGIGYRSAAENILSGEATATRALGLWMDSPGHRANLMNCAFTNHGVGRADSHWTHVFLRDPS